QGDAIFVPVVGKLVALTGPTDEGHQGHHPDPLPDRRYRRRADSGVLNRLLMSSFQIPRVFFA
ncbi:MAG: hypothetical protein AABZ85_07790, partial [Thermodesulfobacteriota bacterium]